MAKRSVGLLSCLALLACESGNSAPPTEPAIKPNGIALSVSRAVIATPRTWNAIIDIDVVRTGSFSGTVDLSIEGLPPGVNGLFTTASLSSTASRSRVDVEVDSTAAYGTYPLTVRAKGAGVAASTAAISLVVPRPSFAFSASPDITYSPWVHSVTGDSWVLAQMSVAVARDTTFRGPVVLSVPELPAGFVPALVPTIPPDRSLSSVTVNVASTVAAGTYPVRVQATATDAEPRFVTINVVVPPR